MASAYFKICVIILISAYAHCRTVTHTETATGPNGEKVTRSWTSTSNDDMSASRLSFPKDVEVFNGLDIGSMQSDTEVHVLGGTNINEDSILRDPSVVRHMDATAVLELFRTKQPVTRESTDDAGQKSKTTYSLLPDGSVKSVTTRVSQSSNPTIGSQPGWRLPYPPLQSRFNLDSPTNSWHSFDDEITERRHKPKEQTTTDGAATTVRLPETWDPTRWRIFDERMPAWRSDSRFETEWPSLPTTTTKKPKIRSSTTTILPPIPGLDEFLKKQYGSTQNVAKPTTTLQLEDFPITGLYQPGKPIDDSFLRNASALPNSNNQDMPVNSTPISEQTQVNTKVKTLTRTVTTSSLPTTADLDGNMLDILSRAGIRPEDVQQSSDGTITKTRTEPDGRRITTTYRVNRIPATTYTSNVQRNYVPVETTTVPPLIKHNAVFNNPIDNFLAKLNMNTDDILVENGLLVKKITDADGRILTVNFTLSTVKHELEEKQRRANEAMQQSPVK